MSSTSMMAEGAQTSSLLRLPFEIRLMIYEYLLLPSATPCSGRPMSVANLIPDFHTYYSKDTNDDPFTLSVRTIDPWLGGQSLKTWRKRSTYHVRTGPFLTTTAPTTYRVLLSPYTAHLRYTVPSLMSVSSQIHAEASKVLYSTYTFSFHMSVEAIVPFLSDLTPRSRASIRHMSVTKKALPYAKEFDRAEWADMCAYLASATTTTTTTTTTTSSTNQGDGTPSMHLSTLNLQLIAGKPDLAWDSITPMNPADFDTMLRMKNEWLGGTGDCGGVDLEWAEQVMAIKGLSDIKVRALVERCARPVSERQAFWVAFSKSVAEGGFEEWMKARMLEA